MYGYVIFTDIEKYSTLKDADLKIFFNKIIPIIFEELKTYKDAAIIWNTWGDAIFAIYDKAETAINMALAYREAFSKIDFEKFGIKKLNPRIAGNFGEFELIFDSVSGKKNVHGTLVNLTARIEPVTTPGEIFVTKEFKDMSISSYDKVDNVRFEDMGEIKLPKNAGTLNLYRLCKRADTSMKPAGIVLRPIMDYNIQAPMTNSKTNETKIKLPEKSIEERLSGSLNKKASSDEKLNKIANALKEDKIVKRKEKNLIKSFFKSFESDTIVKSGKDPKKLLAENPFFLAMFVFIIAMFINFILDMVLIKNSFKLNLSFISPQIMATISPWIWLLGYLISAFAAGQIVTFMHKKIIKIRNIIITPFLILLLHMFLYVLPNSSSASTLFFMQNLYINIILLWLFCFAGLSKGIEGANDRINLK